MFYLGCFWGIICIFMLIGSSALFLLRCFNNIFLGGLSKKNCRKLIDTTLQWINTLEETHTIFGIGALISSLIHGVIMKFFVEESILGVISLILFIFIFVMGVIDKFIYRDARGIIKRYHMWINILFIIIVFFHMMF